MMAQRRLRTVTWALSVLGLFQALAGRPARSQTPQIVAERASQFKIDTAGIGVGQITQFALGPDGRLYASTADRGVESFRYDAASGKLADMQTASNISGLG